VPDFTALNSDSTLDASVRNFIVTKLVKREDERREREGRGALHGFASRAAVGSDLRAAWLAAKCMHCHAPLPAKRRATPAQVPETVAFLGRLLQVRDRTGAER
jgi:hypothetical protein